MQPLQGSSSRKKMLLWGAAALASVAAFRIFGSAKTTKPETVKMLTEDGKLVEVDKNMLAAGGKKITDKELQQWVKHENNQH